MSDNMDTNDMTHAPQRTRTPKLRFPEFRDAPGWELKKLDDIASFYKGKGISKADIDLQGETLCIRYGELYTVYDEVIKTVFSKTNLPVSELFLSQEKDVLIPSSGETKIDIAKASCVLLSDVALGGDLNILRSNENGVFLSYLLNGPYKREIAKKAQGDTVVHLYANQLKLLEVALPKEVEQRRIADCLASLDDLIAAHSDKLAALKAHKRGLLQQLFPAEGETVPRLRFPEFEDAGEWEEKKLGKIATIRSGTTPLRANTQYYESGSIPWVKTTDLNNSFIHLTEERITPLAQARVNPEGSILVAMYGGFKQIGRTGYLKVPAATNQAISVLNTNQEMVIPLYLLIWLNAKVDYWKKFASSSRKDPNITGTDVANFPIIFPSPSEQQRIADCLTSIDEQIAAQGQRLDALKAHKRGLMQQLFPSADEVQA